MDDAAARLRIEDAVLQDLVEQARAFYETGTVHPDPAPTPGPKVMVLDTTVQERELLVTLHDWRPDEDVGAEEPGRLDLRLFASYQPVNAQINQPGQPTVNNGGTGNSPEWRVTTNIGYSIGDFSLRTSTRWRNELVESFSHGMKQRLVMSAAFLHRPKAVLVDEPMVGLDPKGQKFLKELFRAFVDRGGTVLMSTHTLDMVEEMCDRIGIVSGGRIAAAAWKSASPFAVTFVRSTTISRSPGQPLRCASPASW